MVFRTFSFNTIISNTLIIYKIKINDKEKYEKKFIL